MSPVKDELAGGRGESVVPDVVVRGSTSLCTSVQDRKEVGVRTNQSQGIRGYHHMCLCVPRWPKTREPARTRRRHTGQSIKRTGCVEQVDGPRQVRLSLPPHTTHSHHAIPPRALGSQKAYPVGGAQSIGLGVNQTKGALDRDSRADEARSQRPKSLSSSSSLSLLPHNTNTRVCLPCLRLL